MKNTPYSFYPFSISPFILSFQYRKEEIILNHLLLRYNKPIIIRLCGELLTRTTESMLAIIMIIYVNKMLNGNIMMTMLIFGLQPLSDIIFTLIAGRVTDKYGRKKLCYSAYCCKALQSAASSLLNPFYICFVICHKWGWPFLIYSCSTCTNS